MLGADARLAVNDEPEFTEAQLLAGDRERNVNRFAAGDQAALEQQVHMLRCLGGL